MYQDDIRDDEVRSHAQSAFYFIGFLCTFMDFCNTVCQLTPQRAGRGRCAGGETGDERRRRQEKHVEVKQDADLSLLLLVWKVYMPARGTKDRGAAYRLKSRQCSGGRRVPKFRLDTKPVLILYPFVFKRLKHVSHRLGCDRWGNAWKGDPHETEHGVV